MKFALFSPYNSKSPLYTKEIKGRKVRYSIQVLLEDRTLTIRQFTGKIRRAQTAAGDWTVSLSCLDAAEDLLGPANLPTYAVPYHMTGTSYEYNSHWVIDQLLRAQGYSYTPLERDDVSFYCSFHGGSIPTHGWNFYESVGAYAPPLYRWVQPTPGDGMGATGYSSLGQYLFRGTGSPENIPRPDNGHTVGISCRTFGRPPSTGAMWSIVQYFNGRNWIEPGNGIPSSDLDPTAWAVLRYEDGQVRVDLHNGYNGATLDQTVSFNHATVATDQWN